MDNVKKVLDKQKLFYESGKTKEMSYRAEKLKLLSEAIKNMKMTS